MVQWTKKKQAVAAAELQESHVKGKKPKLEPESREYFSLVQ